MRHTDRARVVGFLEPVGDAPGVEEMAAWQGADHAVILERLEADDAVASRDVQLASGQFVTLEEKRFYLRGSCHSTDWPLWSGSILAPSPRSCL
jgi:hypothetical protein